ncbi:class I SAM-dependent methyltransferase [Undibacterium sp. TS12]|uniref:class I SAM-dependent methyltransferase n=1 Tax=Undibacterium sp. TS12 TaxID=2908202 RepID=UPI001F4CF710|nr:class I SAM-dependent methyltransferase [Undibacterium sp. TS12]MCH8621681.1 class I SAM-dependent methyltransferase [Undibacterium sp. TS12]
MQVVASKTRKGKFLHEAGILVLPVFRALLAQVLAFALSYLLYFLDKRLFGGLLPPFLLLGFHATCSVLISVLLRLSWWWWLIQFIFPFAVVASLVFQLPPGLSLAIFVLMVLLFWSTYRTQVPYFPSKSSLLPCILEQLPQRESLRFIDIGSGFGGVSISLSKSRSSQCFYGVELAPFPWLVSWLRARFSGGMVQFYLRDYMDLDFSGFDVVFAYLSPAAMPDLWEKLHSEMRPGSLFMSYEFTVPGVEADLIINSNANDPALYVWRI